MPGHVTIFISVDVVLFSKRNLMAMAFTAHVYDEILNRLHVLPLLFHMCLTANYCLLLGANVQRQHVMWY